MKDFIANPPALAPWTTYFVAVDKESVFGLTPSQLGEWAMRQGLPAYRGRQLAVWLYSRRVTDYALMTDLPSSLRQKWASETPIDLPTIDAVRQSRDGTEKYLVTCSDGLAVETVFMPMRPGDRERPERLTACISTQVGCALGCTFCATATMGLKRHLSAGEIVAQVLLVQRRINPRKLTNLVFMGMGEPLHNVDNAVQAVEVIASDPGMEIGRKRITVSTVGLVPEIYRLADSGIGVKLAISLNATTDEARSTTMPINRRYPLAALMDAARYYAETSGMRVTFEYVVLEGQNDRDEDALRMASLVRGIPCKINLIPYNPNPLMPFQRPNSARLEHFRDLLYPRCPAVTIRYSKGVDIAAACGQLVAESSEPRSAGRAV